MSYHLRFAYQLKKKGSQVLGEPNFAKDMVKTTTSEVAEIVDLLTSTFEKVALLPDSEKVKIPEKVENLASNAKKTSQKVTTLNPVDDIAFIAKATDVDPEIMSKVSEKLASYISSFSNKTEGETILSSDWDLDFVVLIELIELRNFLSKYIKNLPRTKKMYKNGYIYVHKF